MLRVFSLGRESGVGKERGGERRRGERGGGKGKRGEERGGETRKSRGTGMGRERRGREGKGSTRGVFSGCRVLSGRRRGEDAYFKMGVFISYGERRRDAPQPLSS